MRWTAAMRDDTYGANDTLGAFAPYDAADANADVDVDVDVDVDGNVELGAPLAVLW